MSICPCGISALYDDCCAPYHAGTSTPPTAEALMRSRYSAFVKNKMAYLADTLTAESRKTYDATETVKWAKAAKWEKLEIISTDKGREDDTDGHVEFKAYYTMNGSKQIHHEHATFNKEDGAWKYAEGHFTHKAEPRIVPTKIGRNDPCICGSGKKYKKCCGA